MEAARIRRPGGNGPGIAAESGHRRALRGLAGAAALGLGPGRGVVAWGVTHHDTFRRILTDPRVSKDARQHRPAWANGEVSPDWPLFIWVAVKNVFTAYGGEHKWLRTLVSKAFTARRVTALRPRVEQITADLLDGFADTPAGQPVDLCESFPIPCRSR